MKEIAFYGDGYSEIVIAATLELLMRNKRVVVCELGGNTKERDIFRELELTSGIRGGEFLRVTKGYDKLDCDYKFYCMGTDGMWLDRDIEHYMIINYSWHTIASSLDNTRSVDISPKLVILGPKIDELTDIVNSVIDDCHSVRALPYNKNDYDVLMELRMGHLSCMRLYSKELREILEDIME